MKTYRIEFNGREKNAIGVTYRIVKEVRATDEQAARLKLYETHEHILVSSIVEVPPAREKLRAVTLILSDARGIYIPRDFVTDNNNEIATDHCAAWGLTDDNRDQWADAADPESEWYWEAWTWILDNAKFTDADGDVYILHQDGDLWGLCVERMTDEEKSNFGFED